MTAAAPIAVNAKPARYLTFSLGRESYGVPVLNVREIIRLCPITPVPSMPAHIRGVINLRGTVLAVLDLRAKFQMPAGEYNERTCIIVIQVASPSGQPLLMGAIVDAVEEVLQLADTEIEPAPDFGMSSTPGYIIGMATVHGSVKILLNIEKIFLEDGTLALPAVTPADPTTQNSPL
ncbi:MAG: chemotaxis protein CheW [Verrucomicrobiota bacterium]